ncbi:hypothetical protein BDV12DRAFT_130142 [Aspergillus spectabilis]
MLVQSIVMMHAFIISLFLPSLLPSFLPSFLPSIHLTYPLTYSTQLVDCVALYGALCCAAPAPTTITTQAPLSLGHRPGPSIHSIKSSCSHLITSHHIHNTILRRIQTKRKQEEQKAKIKQNPKFSNKERHAWDEARKGIEKIKA